MAPNSSGKLTGASENQTWYTRNIDLMSATNVLGTNIFSSSGHDTGIDNRQYAIFILKPELVAAYGTKRMNYWFKNVASSTHFANIFSNAGSNMAVSSRELGVRPRFLIG